MNPTNLVFIIGAGGSQWLNYPNTNEFLNIIRTTAADSKIKKYDKFSKGSKEWAIYDCISQFYRDKYRKVDVEYIYTKVLDFWRDLEGIIIDKDFEELQFFLYLSRYYDKEKILFKEQSTIIKPEYLRELRAELDSKITTLKEVIEELVYDSYWRINYKVDELDGYDNLFSIIDYFFIKLSSISIFTTNYDVALENYFNHYCPSRHSNYRLDDGFRKSEDLQIFNEKLLKQSKKIKLYKIHGSVDRCLLEGIDGIVKLETDSPPVNVYKRRKINKRFIIYPIKNKIDYAEQGIGQFESEQLANKINRAKLIIILGSSLRDNVINQIIVENTKEDQWIIIISPNAKDKSIEYNGTMASARIHYINTSFPGGLLENTLIDEIKSLPH